MKKRGLFFLIPVMLLSMVSCGRAGTGTDYVQDVTEKPTAPPKYSETVPTYPVVINADTFLGEWSSGKNNILIEKSGEGYTAAVRWRTGGGATMKDSSLTYNCVYDESRSVMICSGGVLYETEYLGDGETAERKVYEDGTGVFSIDVKTNEWQGRELHEYTLLWLDDKDDSFRDWVFERLQ